ncbi:unnamed protein product, partial [marine sediment metagenome]
GVMQSLGYMSKYKLRYYPLDWNLHEGAGDYLKDEIGKFAVEIREGIRPGDVVIFRFGRCESHAGIMVAQNLFVHCYLTAKYCKYGVLKNSIWVKRWTRTYRWRNEAIKKI